MKLYTTREAADRLGVTTRTIQTWIHAGKLPGAYKLNPDGPTSPYRIPEEDIIAFEQQRQERRPAANNGAIAQPPVTSGLTATSLTPDLHDENGQSID